MENPAKILIVDDRPEKLLAIEAVLEDLHQHIVRAYSGREALRHILDHDFAVILLDINMPGMDGFETASLIRQRTNSRHTPIIFVTAFGDELHAARGYSLGAVDYILAPVVPDVLRTKVSVFVELFAKTEQVKRQAETLHRRASQMQKLAAASLVINTALSTERMLQTITETARDIIGSHQAITLYLAAGDGRSEAKSKAFGSFSEKYGNWNSRELRIDAIGQTRVARSHSATRMTEQELRNHPDWEIVRHADIPPVYGGMLAAPLKGREGTNLGVIYVCDRYEGQFTYDDEAVLVQLAQMGSIAIENTIYAQERQANRLKDEFLATLGHELRSPLNAIIGWTQLLKLEKPEGEIAHGIEIIDRNARAQAKLIEDLLDVSRIASGKLRLNLCDTALGPVIQAAADAARPIAEAKQISLEVQLAGGSVPVSIDPDRIQQVAMNLLSNALKFTATGGKILVEVEHKVQNDAKRVVLRVKDNGTGMDAKFLPYAFDRFRQADSSSTRPQGGLGIGLAIVRNIVEQHGGSVIAESPGIGCGSIFTVELPVASARAEKIPGPHARDIPPPVQEDMKLIQGLRILVVDDEADARDVIAATLGRAGADVAVAGSAADALKLLKESSHDLLVSDLAMPNQDGFALVRQIRSRPTDKHGDIPAIALTAYAREDDRIRALHAGFQAHLAKPVEPAELIRCVNDLISRPAHNIPALRLAD